MNIEDIVRGYTNEQYAEMYQNDSLKADSLFAGMREGIRLVNSTSIYDAGVFQGVLMMMRANEMLREGIFIKPEQIINYSALPFNYESGESQRDVARKNIAIIAQNNKTLKKMAKSGR